MMSERTVPVPTGRVLVVPYTLQGDGFTGLRLSESGIFVSREDREGGDLLDAKEARAYKVGPIGDQVLLVVHNVNGSAEVYGD